jgi:hypothetical protein
VNGQGEETARRPTGFALAAFVVAFAATCVAVVGNLVSVAGDDRPVVRTALLAAVVALLLVGAAWRRMPIAGRALSVLMIPADLWVLLDGFGRRMLGL